MSGTQSGAPGPDASTRLRLVELVSAHGSFPFGGGLACVLTTADQCTEIATHLSRAVIGPRSSDVGGTMEIAGRYVALHSLPAPLLGPSAAVIIDDSLLEQIWQSACAGRRAELESEHAARRLDRHRSEAALERVRQRASAVAERAAEPQAPPPPPPAPDPFAAITPRIEAALDALANLQLIPSPVACELADQFDELAARVAELAERPVEVDDELSAFEERVAAARYGVAHNAGGVAPEARARIESHHREVVAAESALFEAKRKDRAGALARYQAALAAEHGALTEAGVDSYAAFLVAIAQGAPRVDPEVRLRAELELADAQQALDAARRERGLDIADDPARVEVELRAMAAQILQHFPGDDPARELRELRIPPPEENTRREELRQLLASVDVPVTGDVVTAAVDALQAHAAATRAPVRVEDEDDTAVPLGALRAEIAEEQLAIHNETVALAHECDQHERALADLDLQLADLDRLKLMNIGELDPASTHVMIDGLLDAYRAGDLFAGRLPLVVAGAFDSSDPVLIAAKLGRVDDIQVVVVTNEHALADALATTGAAVVAASSGTTAARAASVPEAHTPNVCARHPEKAAATECSQCGRPSCVDCLVYVPGEPELWCVSCADAMRSRNLRLLRRRGA
jgi:hypothetical protein